MDTIHIRIKRKCETKANTWTFKLGSCYNTNIACIIVIFLILELILWPNHFRTTMGMMLCINIVFVELKNFA